MSYIYIAEKSAYSCGIVKVAKKANAIADAHSKEGFMKSVARKSRMVSAVLVASVALMQAAPIASASINRQPSAGVFAKAVSHLDKSSINSGMNILASEIKTLARENGKEVGVTLINLKTKGFWSLNGNWETVAASTYKLPLLMDVAQGITTGRYNPNSKVCGIPSDVVPPDAYNYVGQCFTLNQLGYMIGHNSDNTAAHMLTRYIGNYEALNTYARQHGAQNPQFYWPNNTDSNDLARLWLNEAQGKAGGSAAQRWLYPKLTHTDFEGGIPAGVPPGAVVVHKVGMLYGETNDAALVRYKNISYVLAIVSNGPGGTDWNLLASISRDVWKVMARS